MHVGAHVAATGTFMSLPACLCLLALLCLLCMAGGCGHLTQSSPGTQCSEDPVKEHRLLTSVRKCAHWLRSLRGSGPGSATSLLHVSLKVVGFCLLACLLLACTHACCLLLAYLPGTFNKHISHVWLPCLGRHLPCLAMCKTDVNKQAKLAQNQIRAGLCQEVVGGWSTLNKGKASRHARSSQEVEALCTLCSLDGCGQPQPRTQL